MPYDARCTPRPQSRLDSYIYRGYIRGMEPFYFFLTEQQKTALRALSEDTGLSIAELIRRAVDTYLKEAASVH